MVGESAATAGADARRRGSATARRKRVIQTLSRELDASVSSSSAAKFAALLAGPERPMIVSADIDGLVSAAMLAQVSAWRAVALVVKSESVLLHPSVATGLQLSDCFAVDVYSSYIPSVSNHVLLWGRKNPAGEQRAGEMARAYDATVIARAEQTLALNPSLWAGIEATTDNDKEPTAMQYRYPLGTAQFVLALLEAINRSPRLFDRDFLPWLLANCDGGLESIGRYAFNARVWWPSLAAAVGPSSISELVYQTAARQRPNEFSDVVHRLRSEGAGQSSSVANSLSDRWNLASPTKEHIARVVEWLAAISGWADPLHEGAERLGDWVSVPIASRGTMPIVGLPPGATIDEQLDEARRHLRSALLSFHTGFVSFREGTRLVWNVPWDTASSAAATTALPKELASE